MSCNVFQMTCDYKNHWENQPNQFFCRFFKNLRIEIWRFDMTSKSVRRNVTRSWGLSLEKIEFFSTDFLRWVSFPMPQRDIIHSQSLVTIIMFSYSKIICRHLSAKKNWAIFKCYRINTSGWKPRADGFLCMKFSTNYWPGDLKTTPLSTTKLLHIFIMKERREVFSWFFPSIDHLLLDEFGTFFRKLSIEIALSHLIRVVL